MYYLPRTECAVRLCTFCRRLGCDDCGIDNEWIALCNECKEKGIAINDCWVNLQPSSPPKDWC